MKILSWNVRGLSAPDKKRLVKRALKNLECDIVLLQETKLVDKKMNDFIKSCYNWNGLSQSARGSAGGLGVLWKSKSYQISIIFSHHYLMVCRVVRLEDHFDFPLLNVYGPIRTEDKKELWNEIKNQMENVGLERIIMAGDFNALLELDDKEGGLRKSTQVMEDFRIFIDDMQVMDIVPKNGKLTWTNRRQNFSNISERLDRFFVG